MAKYKFVVYDYYREPLGKVIGEALKMHEARKIRDDYIRKVDGECDTSIVKVRIVNYSEEVNNA